MTAPPSPHHLPRPVVGAARQQGTLERLARRWGILPAYTDALGQRRTVAPEVLLRLLPVLGAPVAGWDDVEAALTLRRREQARELLPPVVVVWDGDRPGAPLRVPATAAPVPAAVALELEDGSVREEVVPLELRRSFHCGGDAVVTALLPLPAGLPWGYHRLAVAVGGERAEALLIRAPSSTEPLAGGQLGVFLPLYALTRWDGGPLGTFPDLHRLARWAAGRGASLVATLPLYAAFLDPRCPPWDPSPYAPASRRFWNELYVDPEALPERALLEPGAGGPDPEPGGRRVDFPAAAARRRHRLEALAEAFFTRGPEARRGAFERFCAGRPEVCRYTAFRAAGERLCRPWRQWPAAVREGDPGAAGDERARRYHLYAQWAAHEQLRRGNEGDGAAGLFLDLPVGVHPESYDTWADRDVHTFEASLGAPPDGLFARGQDWGLSPWVPERLRRAGLRPWIDTLRFALVEAGALRVDHVMQLSRLFWVPRGGAATDGVYVRSPVEELWAVLCLESRRARCPVVGEDLGTVPLAVRRDLAAHGTAGLYVGLFELGVGERGEAWRTPVPAGRVALVGSHDMPTFRGFWEGRDLALRRRLGLVAGEAAEAEGAGRERLVTALAGRWPAAPGEAPWRAALHGLLGELAASEAALLVVSLEDLWGEPEPQNVPGTGPEEQNFQRRAARSLISFGDDPQVTGALEELARRRGGAR
jgi:4-alpha-glucanotransferase